MLPQTIIMKYQGTEMCTKIKANDLLVAHLHGNFLMAAYDRLFFHQDILQG